MTLTPGQIRARENYLKLEVELGGIEDDAHDALELTQTEAINRLTSAIYAVRK